MPCSLYQPAVTAIDLRGREVISAIVVALVGDFITAARVNNGCYSQLKEPMFSAKWWFQTWLQRYFSMSVWSHFLLSLHLFSTLVSTLARAPVESWRRGEMGE